MKKLLLLITCLALIGFIAGCTEAKTDSQTTELGKLILNQDAIKTIEVVKGAAEPTSVVISESTAIAALLNKVKEIPVNRLTNSEDEGFMPERIQDASALNVRFYSDNTTLESIEGEFLIWPDGYIYAVDVKSMKSNQRTISYLSQLKYPEIYKWLIDISNIDDPSSADMMLSQFETAEQFVKSQGYQIIMNSGANFELQLPGSFDEIKNGVEIGALLKNRNELSKQNGLDFSNYLGKQVTLVAYAVENERKEAKDINLILDGSQIIGFWIDNHVEPPDFNVIVSAYQSN